MTVILPDETIHTRTYATRKRAFGSCHKKLRPSRPCKHTSSSPSLSENFSRIRRQVISKKYFRPVRLYNNTVRSKPRIRNVGTGHRVEKRFFFLFFFSPKTGLSASFVREAFTGLVLLLQIFSHHSSNNVIQMSTKIVILQSF